MIKSSGTGSLSDRNSGQASGRCGLYPSVFRKYLSRFGVTDSQTSLLFILSKMEGRSQKELTHITKLEKSSLNRNLARLIKQELISKEHFPMLTITPKGKQLTNDIIPTWRLAMAEIQEKLTAEGEQALNILHESLMSNK